MVIVLVIVFVVMASEIARAVSPWKFATVVIGEIVAIETIYTKNLVICGKPSVFRYLRHASAAEPGMRMNSAYRHVE
ncbi:hypothetical protein [Paraburkholderia acidisoli]|uniref:Uncharacterized protein n=1 Tax=Paraburkholderia acidisoli TaxID=2571748 RepID=A0A7Z2JHW6_9BURK|nr:hypothetical protein [Paraburkholderia acidisoli]QGZ63680.1 hypothetical protein FAZ98_18075 [Paraburkholderia acidisoli]